MITGKINLQALTHVKMEMKGKNGQVAGIFIPFEKNHIHVGEKGCYLDLVAFEMKEPKNGSTHIVKQSLPKTVRDAQTKEEKDAMPILGNLNAAGAPNNDVSNDAGDGKVFSPDDDLPF